MVREIKMAQRVFNDSTGEKFCCLSVSHENLWQELECVRGYFLDKGGTVKRKIAQTKTPQYQTIGRSMYSLSVCDQRSGRTCYYNAPVLQKREDVAEINAD